MDGCGEKIQEPAQCKEQLLKNTTSVDSRCGKTKSYRCQVCNKIFLSAHQLFSHELRDHDHVGILQIDDTKKQILPKYNQCEKVSSSENGAHVTNMHDRNLWKESANLKDSQHEGIPQVEPSVRRGTLQKQDESNQTHASNLEGKLQLQDGELQSESSDIRGKPQKQDGNQQTHTCNMGGKSQKQDGNQQTDICSMGRKLWKQNRDEQRYTCNIGRKSQKQGGNQQTDTCSMGRESQKQDGDQETDTGNVGRKTEKQDGDQQMDTKNRGRKSQKQDGEQHTNTCNMRRKSQKQDGDQETDTGNLRRKSEKQDGDQQLDTGNTGRNSQKQDGNQQKDSWKMGRKSQQQDGNQQTYICNLRPNSQIQDGYLPMEVSGITKSSDSVHRHKIKMHNCVSEVDTQNMNIEQESHTVEVCSSEFEGSTHEKRNYDGGLFDQNTYHMHKESFILDRQQFVCEVQDHNKEAELGQQSGRHCESTVTWRGGKNVSDMVILPEVTSPSKGIPLPYKCQVCGEYFGTKCDLFYHDLHVHVGIKKPATIKSWDKSFKDAQKNLKEKATLTMGDMKRKANNIPEEQQPVKVIITDTQHTDKQDKQNIKNPVAEQVTLNTICETDPGNEPIQKGIMKKRIMQGEEKTIKVKSGKHEHMQETIQAITGKYPWNKTLVERGRGSELDKQGGQTQPKTLVVVKNGPQNGEGNNKKSGKYRIDVTNYLVTKSQVKQFLMNCDGSNKG